jgi:hypothetical protein
MAWAWPAAAFEPESQARVMFDGHMQTFLLISLASIILETSPRSCRKKVDRIWLFMV